MSDIRSPNNYTGGMREFNARGREPNVVLREAVDAVVSSFAKHTNDNSIGRGLIFFGGEVFDDKYMLINHSLNYFPFQ